MDKKLDLRFLAVQAHWKQMSTAEQIIHEIATLRPEKQSEVLEFVEFLKEKEKRSEENAFRSASLASAMRGMEDEDSLYSESDVVEKMG
jgi:hypothetical protein